MEMFYDTAFSEKPYEGEYKRMMIMMINDDTEN